MVRQREMRQGFKGGDDSIDVNVEEQRLFSALSGKKPKQTGRRRFGE